MLNTSKFKTRPRLKTRPKPEPNLKRPPHFLTAISLLLFLLPYLTKAVIEDICGTQNYAHQWNQADLSINYYAMDIGANLIGLGGTTTSVTKITSLNEPFDATSTDSDGAVLMAFRIGENEPMFGTLITESTSGSVRVHNVHAIAVEGETVYAVLESANDSAGWLYVVMLHEDSYDYF